MNLLLFRFVTLAGSLLLTLPAGWCSGFADDRADSVAAQATCCQAAGHGESPRVPETPIPPSDDCCCSWDATALQRSVVRGDFSSPTGFPADAILIGSAFPAVRSCEAVAKPVHYGPRLHVLQCVWRC